MGETQQKTRKAKGASGLADQFERMFSSGPLKESVELLHSDFTDSSLEVHRSEPRLVVPRTEEPAAEAPAQTVSEGADKTSSDMAVAKVVVNVVDNPVAKVPVNIVDSLVGRVPAIPGHSSGQSTGYSNGQPANVVDRVPDSLVVNPVDRVPVNVVDSLVDRVPAKVVANLPVNTSMSVSPSFWHPFTEKQGRILMYLIKAGGITNRQEISQSLGIGLPTIKHSLRVFLNLGYLSSTKMYIYHNLRGFSYTLNQAMCAEFAARVFGTQLPVSPVDRVVANLPVNIVDRVPANSSDNGGNPFSSKVFKEETLTTKTVSSLLEGDLELNFWKAEEINDRQIHKWAAEFDLPVEDILICMKHARFEILEKEKNGDIVKSAANWFYRVMQRSGYYARPANYKSLIEQRAEQVAENRKKQEEARFIIEQAEVDSKVDAFMADPTGELYQHLLSRVEPFALSLLKEGDASVAMLEVRALYLQYLAEQKEK